MLRGSSAGHPLAEQLRRAAAPGRAEELAGEAEVMAAFQAAFVSAPVLSEQTHETPRETRSSLRSLLAKALTAPVVGIALAVGAVGGVAIAANGGMPVHLGEPAPKKTPVKTTPPPLTRKRAVPSATPAPAASPDLLELCRKYFTEGRRTKQLPALIKAAGGRQKVIGYCLSLLGEKAKQGGGLPGGWPTDWPKGWPEEWTKNQKPPEGWPKEWFRPPERDRKPRVPHDWNGQGRPDHRSGDN